MFWLTRKLSHTSCDGIAKTSEMRVSFFYYVKKKKKKSSSFCCIRKFEKFLNETSEHSNVLETSVQINGTLGLLLLFTIFFVCLFFKLVKIHLGNLFHCLLMHKISNDEKYTEASSCQ